MKKNISIVVAVLVLLYAVFLILRFEQTRDTVREQMDRIDRIESRVEELESL